MDPVRPFLFHVVHISHKKVNLQKFSKTNLENFYVSFVNDVYALNKSRNLKVLNFASHLNSFKLPNLETCNPSWRSLFSSFVIFLFFGGNIFIVFD